MVSEFCIFTFFSWFLNVIFLLMFFPLNNFVKASNTSLGVFKEYTWGMRWSLIDFAMILLVLTKFFLWIILYRICNDSLCLDQVLLLDRLCFISHWSWNIPTDTLVQVIFFKDQGDPILPCSEVVNSPNLIIKLGVMSHFELRTSNGNNRDLDLTNLRCPTSFMS